MLTYSCHMWKAGHVASKKKLRDCTLSIAIKREESNILGLEYHLFSQKKKIQNAAYNKNYHSKTVLSVLKDKEEKIVITKELVRKWLGNEKVDYGKKESADQIGTVTGLAYTSFGGDILQIEANQFEGKGRLVLTGKLGDVMKESASIALDYLRSHSKQYELQVKSFEDIDIHIHVPEGAVPKDGPSAGVTMTTALASCLSNTPVKSDLAMTGEVTLRGNVLPIGGLKEKSLAAHRSGITTILIPKGNVKDLDDIPQEVKDSITYIPVSTVDEVLEHALVK